MARSAVESLLSRDLDFATGFYWNTPDSIERTPLWRDDYVVARARRRRVRQISMDDYLAAGHVLLSLSGDFTGVVDQALTRRKLRRRVVVTTPYVMAALTIVANTDLVATLPRRLAQTYAATMGLNLYEPPLPLRKFEVAALRARRTAPNPVSDHVLDCLQSAARAGDEGISTKRAGKPS